MRRYFDALSKVDGIQFMSEAPYGKTNRWLTTLTVNTQKTGIGRTKIIDALEKTPRYVDLDRMENSSPIGWRSSENR